MFNYTLDKKEEVIDAKGNRIIDLTKGIFSRTSGQIQDYEIIHMDEVFQMRPDLVSQAMYDTDLYTEFILKFAGISNPFTLDKDDTLLVPNITQAKGMMEYENRDSVDAGNGAGRIAQIRNFYKFVNTEYKSDKSSYDALEKMKIPSGVIDTNAQREYIVPYISEDGRTAVTIRNNKVYFGEDTGMQTADQLARATTGESVTKSVQSIIEKAQTEYSETNCLYNGMSVADWVRANVKK